nr:N-(5'-phosphoribosyl)anthranilate isomerase [Chloroflexia bacterium]
MTLVPGMVKICGLRDVEHALVAAEAGATALGFILAPSRRQVTPELLNEVRAHLAAMDPSPRIVAVVVNEPEAALRDIVERARPDVVQFSGDEVAAILHDLGA